MTKVLQFRANRTVWDRHLRSPSRVGWWGGVAAYNERNVQKGQQWRVRRWRNQDCGDESNEEVNRREGGQLHILFHDRTKCNPRLSFHEAGQSRRKRRVDQWGTHLFRFLILSILHCVVDMAQHILDRIRVRQIEWKERHQWMVLNLSTTSCENFVRKQLHLQEITTMLKVDSSCRHAREWPPGITKGEKRVGST